MADLDNAIRGAIAYEQDVSLRAALLAALNLHSDDEAGFCRECSDEFPAASPCPTVRAIAEKLGISLTG